MFCQNCGTQINGGKFCPNCGTAVTEHENPVSGIVSDPSLPEEIYRDEKGVIRWQFKEGNIIRFFWMDGSRVGYKAVQEQQAQTVGSAFQEFLKSGAALAADNIVMNSDSYAGQDLPWDLSEEGSNSISVGFDFIKKIKRNPKKSEITVSERITSITLNMTPYQYDFVYSYITSHCPNAKIK